MNLEVNTIQEEVLPIEVEEIQFCPEFLESEEFKKIFVQNVGDVTIPLESTLEIVPGSPNSGNCSDSDYTPSANSESDHDGEYENVPGKNNF